MILKSITNQELNFCVCVCVCVRVHAHARTYTSLLKGTEQIYHMPNKYV